ncbi:hypothetical protein WR25_00782 [Diploscapter pachys]|uniref:Carboxylic ester hydrolase n=1 Tax=Diploscapter pachys TaxID=2018661 RepID=A0A2A2KIB2_9BILA|nr:hypothetical protein WR25_00782 [Diploscapter pachys]
MLIILLSSFFTLIKSDIVNIQISTGNVSATIQGQTCCGADTRGWMFRGIPYAQPPVGDLRFSYAQRMDPQGVVNATEYGDYCSQGDHVQEDCLFINVFTPVGVNSSMRLPVFFYIHGGGWEGGSGDFGPGIYSNLVNRGPLVMVSINYRLGPFGFFTSREDTIPGNFAISDMIESLNWAKRYISFFGGDPSRITICGQSSGGESISTLTLSPAARGLFNQAIMQSGSAFGGGVSLCDYRNSSIQLAMTLGCTTADQWNSGQNFAQILQCMRLINATTLQDADLNFPYRHFMDWGTVIDKLYMPDTLENLAMQRPPMNVMGGDVATEWLAWEEWWIQNELNSSYFTRQGVTNQLKTTYEMHCWNNYDAVVQGAEKYYIESQFMFETDHVGWMSVWINLMSDLDFTAAVLRDLKYFTTTGSNAYLYSFDYFSPLAWTWLNITELRQAPHSWEMPYLYDEGCNGYTCQAEDNALRDIIQKCWVNFILTGNPTPINGGLSFVWPKLDNNNRFLSFLPTPQVLSNFHPTTNFFACQAPTLAGSKPPFC